MRNIFATTMLEIASRDPKVIFLTGDIGFNVLEKARVVLGDRFINMGVAEQSMVSIAAGMAYKGNQVFCYSIAPFITYRCLEQIRNDVCFHNLPVFMVGNGGGYGYGIMGPSHHAIEDNAILSGLPNMHCYVPSFDEDVDVCIKDIVGEKRPAYLRLGLAKPNRFQNRSVGFFNKLTSAHSPRVTVVGSGAVMHSIFDAIHENNLKDEAEVFNISKIPYVDLTGEFISSVGTTKKLIIAEEHISIGGIGQQIACDILSRGIPVSVFRSLCAKGYPTGRYGSQQYHMQQSGIDKGNISRVLKDCIK